MLDPKTQAFCDEFDEFAKVFKECMALLNEHLAEIDFQVWAMNERMMDEASGQSG